MTHPWREINHKAGDSVEAAARRVEMGRELERLEFAYARDAGLLDPEDPRYDPLEAAYWDRGSVS
jgi:hypothetical protein